MRKKIILIALFTIILFALSSWKLPVILKIESLSLPPDCETVYPTKVWLSDVYWLHIKGEKVIKCDLGYEAVKEYIETHNSAAKLANISIYEYAGMSDISIYNSEFDESFWMQPDRNYYITISYLKR